MSSFVMNHYHHNNHNSHDDDRAATVVEEAPLPQTLTTTAPREAAPRRVPTRETVVTTIEAAETAPTAKQTQSRPVTADTRKKSLSFFRLMVTRGSGHTGNSGGSNGFLKRGRRKPQQQQQQQEPKKHRYHDEQKQQKKLSHQQSDVLSSIANCYGDCHNDNVVQWLETSCPVDVVPLVLAFCGPQKMAVMGRTNRFWRNRVREEATWRVVCEELYKWKQGDPTPKCWSDYYRLNPCVPVDYPSLSKALNVVTSSPNYSYRYATQDKPLKIFIRPGNYAVKEQLLVDIPATMQITVESMQMPENLYHGPTKSFKPCSSSHESSTLTTKPNKSRAASFKSLMSCRSAVSSQVVEDTEEFRTTRADAHAHALHATQYATHYHGAMRADDAPCNKKWACLYSQTRRHNEPIFRVRQGNLVLKRLQLSHSANGIDIWNGNAAVQVQPPSQDADQQPQSPRPIPAAFLEQVQITSKTGRGVVNIDGGYVNVNNCYIRDCAATGIYIGGPGSKAEVYNTDVIHNGMGNTSNSRRGIARGHSGVYLEQGQAKIFSCNISMNALTGISAVSHEKCVLWLEQSDLVANGTYQLEMPPLGTASRSNSICRNNRYEVRGVPRSRSGLEQSQTHTAIFTPVAPALPNRVVTL